MRREPTLSLSRRSLRAKSTILKSTFTAWSLLRRVSHHENSPTFKAYPKITACTALVPSTSSMAVRPVRFVAGVNDACRTRASGATIAFGCDRQRRVPLIDAPCRLQRGRGRQRLAAHGTRRRRGAKRQGLAGAERDLQSSRRQPALPYSAASYPSPVPPPDGKLSSPAQRGLVRACFFDENECDRGQGFSGTVAPLTALPSSGKPPAKR